jgi:hypothetical protein
MIHAGTIGVKGRAPSELTWRRPTLMENALRRYGSEAAAELVREPGPVYGVIEARLALIPELVSTY